MYLLRGAFQTFPNISIKCPLEQTGELKAFLLDLRGTAEERILGIYDGPPLSKEQVTALVQGGLIDVRRGRAASAA